MIGILIAQLGTPEAPTTPELRKYLRKFLMDKRVVSMPWIFRWLFVHLIILPFRSPKSAHAYASIWTKEGSPLKVISEKQVTALQKILGNNFLVRLGMCLGTPPLAVELTQLVSAKCEKILVVPMFPQYATATTASLSDLIFDWTQKNPGVSVEILPPFCTEEFFIEGTTQRVIEAGFRPDDHLLLSYHGLPESQILDADINGAQCLKVSNCCDVLTEKNKFCYRAQCFETSRLIVKRLGLQQNQWTQSFQSRLGRREWLRPSTTDILNQLSTKKTGRIFVVFPSFVVDCLENLEEVGIREREIFESKSSISLVCVACPNDEAKFMNGMARWIQSSSRAA